jgi:flagellar protein FlaG
MTNISSDGVAASQALANLHFLVPVNQSVRSGSPVSAVQKIQIQSHSPNSEIQVDHASPTSDELSLLVAKMQSKVAATSPELHFSVDHDSGKSIVKVTDQTTKEVIWQFPSESALRISKEMDNFQKGMLLNRKA